MFVSKVQRKRLEYLYYLSLSFLSNEMIEAKMGYITSEVIEGGDDFNLLSNIESPPTILGLFGEVVELWVLMRGGDD